MESFLEAAAALIGRLAAGVQSGIGQLVKADPALANNPVVEAVDVGAAFAEAEVLDFQQLEAAYTSGQAALLGPISVKGKAGGIFAIPNDSEIGKALGLS